MAASLGIANCLFDDDQCVLRASLKTIHRLRLAGKAAIKQLVGLN